MMQKRVYFANKRSLVFAVPIANLPRIHTTDTTTGKVSYELNIPREWTRIPAKLYRAMVKSGRARK